MNLCPTARSGHGNQEKEIQVDKSHKPSIAAINGVDYSDD